jgi:hypothetical protein
MSASVNAKMRQEIRRFHDMTIGVAQHVTHGNVPLSEASQKDLREALALLNAANRLFYGVEKRDVRPHLLPQLTAQYHAARASHLGRNRLRLVIDNARPQSVNAD